MSEFSIIGMVISRQELRSAKGNAYLTFSVKDDAGSIFDLALFGNGMGMASYVDEGKRIAIKGTMASRSYQDKNGVTRYTPSFMPGWIEEVGSVTRAHSDADDINKIPF